MATYQIPLLATSNVKVLRWTTLPPDTPFGHAILQGFDINGNFVANPDTLGPVNWWSTAYDDSAWQSPVVTSGDDPSLGLLHYTLPNPFVGSLDADPIWTVEPETDPNAAMLVRWRFDAPAFVNGSLVAAFSNAGALQMLPTYAYLNLTTGRELNTFGGVADVLGQDLLSSFVQTQPIRLGRILPGASNLLSFTAPYHGYNYSTGALRDRHGHTSTFFMLSLVFDVPSFTTGKSSVQFIG